MDGEETKHRAVLRLTSTKIKGKCTNKSDNIKVESFLMENKLNKYRDLLKKLFEEANLNEFTVRIEGSQ